MADRASVARMKAIAMNDIARTVEKMGGPKAKARLEIAEKKSRRNEALYVMELASVLEETSLGFVPDPTPIKGNMKGLPPDVEELLIEKGYETKHALRQAPDSELLAITGIGPGTLRRIKGNL